MSLNINNTQNIQYQNNRQIQAQQDNFGAISPQAQAHLQKAGESVNNAAQGSLLGSFMEGLGIDLSNPKKAVISILASVAVVFGLSRGMNRLVGKNKLFNFGKAMDNFVQNNKTVQKISKAFSKKIATPIKNLFKKSGMRKTLSQLKGHTLSPVNKMAKPLLKGPKGEALDTCTDTLKTFLSKGDSQASQLKRILFKPDGDEIKKAVSQITDADTLAKIEDTLSSKSILNKFKKRKPVDIQASIDELIKKGDTQRLHELNEIINPKSSSDILDAIKKTTDQSTLDALKNITGKTETQEIVDTVKDTIEHKNLRTMYEKLTGSDKDFQSFIKSIREIETDDFLKYQNFEDFYSKVLQHHTKDGKLDVDALNKTFSELSDNPEFSAKIKGWLGKSDMGLALKKYAILNGDSANSKVSQQIQKMLLRTTEGVTNGVTSSSLMGLLMGLYIYNGVFNKTQDAPKGEKVATVAENAVGDVGNYMMLPVAGSILYGGATLKYLGSGASQITRYKNGLKNLTEQASLGLLSKAEIKAQYKALKQGLNKGVKWYQKPIRALANFVSIGLEQNPTNGKVLRKLKGFGGGAMRFAIVLLGIAPFLTKPVMKVCHKVFGKPTDTSYPDKADEIKKQQEEAMNQLQNMTPEEQYQALLQLSQLPEIANNPEQKAYIDQLLAAYQTQISQQPQQPNTQQPQQPNTQQPLSQPTGAQPISSQPINSGGSQISSIDAGRTYIPSDEPAPGLVRKDIPNI